MSVGQGHFGIPGQTAELETFTAEILWGGDDSRIQVLRQSLVVDGAARDDGNTPTSVLRPGLLLGQVASTGELKEFDAAAVDGTQFIAGILPVELKMTDFDGDDVDRFGPVVVRAPVKASALLVEGSALVGHADEYLVRRQLFAAGFVLNDDVRGHKAGQPRTVVKATDYTVLATDNGTYFTTRGAAAAVEFTLPALKRGLEFEFYSEADQNLTVTAATADTLVAFNDAAADSVAFSTSGEKLGGKFRVRANDDASAWLVEAVGANTVTIAT